MSGPVSSETHDDSNCSTRDAEPRREPQLVDALECDRPLAGSARFSLAGVNEVLLGRGPDRTGIRTTDHGYTTLHVRLPARSMSSTHARLVRVHESWVLEDANSRNGSFVNGQRVPRCALRNGDIVDVGHALLLVRDAMEMMDAPADVDARELQGEPLGFRTIIPRLRAELATLRRLAPTRVPILLLGDTGTGKEAITRGVHAISRRTGPLVAINCGALPQSLVEGQLFGHAKGAFSGATRDEPGFVRSAHRGTLLLDEVGELPKQSQTTLLRVLQEGEVIPIGSSRVTKVDIRVLSATHRSLAGDDSGFRPDLFARLAGFTFRLPSLAERIEDLGVAVADILANHGGCDAVTLTRDLGRRLLQHRWPLNFRELQQSLCAALALTNDGALRTSHFPALHAAAAGGPLAPSPRTAVPAPVRSDEDERLRMVVIAHLREHQGNLRAVTRAMGKAPMQIHRWIKRFGIDPKAYRNRVER
jgi:DNA-binding NtrC family response regulator